MGNFLSTKESLEEMHKIFEEIKTYIKREVKEQINTLKKNRYKEYIKLSFL